MAGPGRRGSEVFPKVPTSAAIPDVARTSGPAPRGHIYDEGVTRASVVEALGIAGDVVET